AGVSRGTLYRVFPGKPALMQGLIATYSPFEAIGYIWAEHGQVPPEVFFRLAGRAVVGTAGEHLGLMRAIFHEATAGSEIALAGIRPQLEATMGTLARYVAGQIAAGRLRPMHPLLALQAFIGPIFFHLMTRPIADEIMGLQIDIGAAVDSLVATSLEGLTP